MLFFLTAVGASEDEEWKVKCATTMRKAGVSDHFFSNVGHAIHSMTIRGIQKFEPNVTSVNIPTANRDMNSDELVLPYVPDIRSPDESKFLTDGMKTLDLVYSHMEDRKYFNGVG